MGDFLLDAYLQASCHCAGNMLVTALTMCLLVRWQFPCHCTDNKFASAVTVFQIIALLSVRHNVGGNRVIMLVYVALLC